MFWKKKRVYLDHAATTPMDARVVLAMREIYDGSYWNPGSITKEGTAARAVLRDARAAVARELSAQSNQIYFTHGGTDSVNRAVQGVIARFKVLADRLQVTGNEASYNLKPETYNLPHVITSAVEHPAVLETIQAMEEKNMCTATYVSVNEKGLIDPGDIKKALTSETILVSIQYANNEIGTIQSIREIAKEIRNWRRKVTGDRLQVTENTTSESPETYNLKPITWPLFHCDAIQGANYLDLHIDRLGVDLLSLSGSKIYGPKNSGILYVRNREMIESITFGGGQEGGVVVGTEDVANAAGFAKALELARDGYEKESKRLAELRDFLIGEVMKIEGVNLNGPTPHLFEPKGSQSLERPNPLPKGEGEILRLPNNIHISVAGISSERLVLELDAKGFSVSSKSACKTDREGASHVIQALRGKAEGEVGFVRITMGRSTTLRDIKNFTETFRKLAERIRKEIR